MINEIEIDEIKKLVITDWIDVNIKDNYSLRCALQNADYNENNSGNWEHSKINSLPSFKKEMFDYEDKIIKVKHFNTFRTFIDTNGNIWDIDWLDIG